MSADDADMSQPPDLIRRILAARVYDVAVRTPLDHMPRLSAQLGRPVYAKREDLQPVFSFKLRGAFNKIVGLSAAERARGVLCASAGNHAQGVALAARTLGCRAVIVMPRTTPGIKVEAVRALGAEVDLAGDTYDDAHAHARAREIAEGLVFVHPYDDLDVIAGQGTVAVEMLQQQSMPIAATFVCVGGGGLLAGVAAYTKFLQPDTQVIACEAEDAACYAAARAAGERVMLSHVGLFADGAAVKQVGALPWAITQSLVDDAVTATTDEICFAMRMIFEDLRAIAEPAGALGVAGLLKWAAANPGTTPLAAIISGANLNFGRLQHVAERTELGAGTEALFAVVLPERAGAFRAFCALVGDRNITEFNYRLGDRDRAAVLVGVRVAAMTTDRETLRDAWMTAGYPVTDLSHDELSKLHLRHLVGGRASSAIDERLVRFEFPERPGALREFLNALDPGWNISLFHYRNHGAAVGRVLAGIQVADASLPHFHAALARLAYPYTIEHEHPAVTLFLR